MFIIKIYFYINKLYKMVKPILISVEGNIGAGKSTIIDHLKDHMKGNTDIMFLKEPVDIWETIKDTKTDENILQKFYNDSNKYAFSFQVMAYVTRLSTIRTAIRENPDCKVIICERSLDADKNIFAKMLYEDNKIEEINYQIYLHFYNEYVRDYKLDGIVYINADADVCYQRTVKRSRNGESSITQEYLQKCKDYYDEWLFTNNKDTDILNIDANEDVTYNMFDKEDKGLEWLQRIERYILNCSEHKNVDKPKNTFIDILENLIT
jgi:deoxyadenosine/deoxycytidine kinase